MNKKKLLSLIQQREGNKLDFKLKIDISSESGKKELAKDVCAIANSKGGRGYLIIGVEDRTKRLVGINKLKPLDEEKIQQVVSSSAEFLNRELIGKYFKSKGIIINKENEKFLLESAGITYLDKINRKVRCTFGGLLVFCDNNNMFIPNNSIRIINKNNKLFLKRK